MRQLRLRCMLTLQHSMRVHGMSVQACSDEDVASTVNIYPGETGFRFQWPLSPPAKTPEEGSQGGTKVTNTPVENLVISLSQAPCAFIVVNSEVLAKGVCPLSCELSCWPVESHSQNLQIYRSRAVYHFQQCASRKRNLGCALMQQLAGVCLLCVSEPTSHPTQAAHCCATS